MYFALCIYYPKTIYFSHQSFLCLFTPISSNHLVHIFNFSRYALMAPSTSLVSASSLSHFDNDIWMPKKYFKHSTSKTELLMFPRPLHFVLVFSILKCIHYLLSLFGSKLRDHPLFFSIITIIFGQALLTLVLCHTLTSTSDNSIIILIKSLSFLMLIIAADFIPCFHLYLLLPILYTATEIIYKK